MMKNVICFLFCLILPLHTVFAGGYHVAVFDYDDRLDSEQTTAKYIERQLKSIFPDIRVAQHTGKQNVPYAIDTLKKLDAQNLDLMITITTDALVIANHVVTKTPTLFTNANNPLFLGFRTLGPPGKNISGVSYYISVEKQLALYKKILPDLDQIGFIFDMNNKSRKVELPEARKACRKMNIKDKIEVISLKSELQDAASSLIRSGAQAVVIGSSGMLYNNIALFKDVCDQSGIPIFSFNKNGVPRGAMAALSSDYDLMVDRLLIPMAVSVLKDKKSPGEMPIAFLDENRIFINLTQAEQLNIKIPGDILDQAVRIR